MYKDRIVKEKAEVQGEEIIKVVYKDKPVEKIVYKEKIVKEKVEVPGKEKYRYERSQGSREREDCVQRQAGGENRLQRQNR